MPPLKSSAANVQRNDQGRLGFNAEALIRRLDQPINRV
jgi:hypothetical protein